MRTRQLLAYGVAVLILLACSSEQRESAPSRDREGVTADTTTRYTTHEMSEGLTRDVRRSDVDLVALEDSLYRALGDSISVVMKEANVRWQQYRKLECDALRLAFAEGTMAPIAQLECWVSLTDARRRFLGEQYDFIRPARVTPGAGAR